MKINSNYNLRLKAYNNPNFKAKIPVTGVDGINENVLKKASSAAASLGIAELVLAKPLIDNKIKSVLKGTIMPYISAETYIVVNDNFREDTASLDKYLEFEVNKYVNMKRSKNPKQRILLQGLLKEIVLERVNNKHMPGDFSDIPFLETKEKLCYSDLILSKKLFDTCIKKGMFFNDIAALTGCHISSVLAKAREYGVHSQRLVYKENVKNLLNYKDEIVKSYESGVSIENLTRQYHVSLNTMRDFLFKHGVKIRPQKIIDINEDELRQCLSAGMTTEDIGEYFSCCPQTIANKLAKLGLKTRRQSEIGKYDDKLSEKNLKACIRKGMNTKEIAELYNSTPVTVGRKLKQYGLVTKKSLQRQRLAAISDKEIEECLKKGMSFFAIAKLFNCSWNTVVRRIKQGKQQDLDKIMLLTPEKLEDRILEACFKSEELTDNQEFMELADFVCSNMDKIDKNNLAKFVDMLEKAARKEITEDEIFKADTVKNIILLSDAEKQEKAKFLMLCGNYSKLIEELSQHENKFLYDIALKYFPNSQADKTAESADYILNVYKNSNENACITARKIAYWDMSKKPGKLLEAAQEFAKEGEGLLNTEKAGQYLVNAAVYKKYLETGDASGYPEGLLKVLADFHLPEKLAVRNLIRIEEWKNNADKASINDFLTYFDENNGNIEKSFIRAYLEDFYLNCDTKIPIVLENGQNHVATLSAKAKRSIFEYNKFPNCIDYLAKFEEVMHKTAGKTQDSGIKFCSNSRTSWYEVKIFTWPDRLYSSANDLYFDTYVPQHK